MKLFSLHILFKEEGKCKMFQGTYELSTFGYFQRSSIKEFLNFMAKLICERTEICKRSAVQEQEYFCHAFVRYDNLCGIVFSDIEYPQRVAQTLLSKVLEDFAQAHPSHLWVTMAQDSGTLKNLDDYLARYQNPHEVDSLLRIQAEVDEMGEILLQTLDSLSQRGEKLDDLVRQSEELSEQSKAFYKTAKKTNRCCSIL